MHFGPNCVFNYPTTGTTLSLSKRSAKVFRILQNCMELLRNGILFPNFFWPTMRKKCSSDKEKLLKFEAEGPDFVKFLRSLEQFIQTVKGQNNFW